MPKTCFVIGWAGLGISRRKRDWLEKRLMCESIRRWHSQYICSHVPEIVEAAPTPEGVGKYIEQRESDFQIFKRQFIDNAGARLNEHLFDDRKARPKPWFTSNTSGDTSGPIKFPANQNRREGDDDNSALQQLLSAYENIWFQGQADYTAYYLGEGPLASHPSTQKRILDRYGFSMVIVTLVLHAAIVIGVCSGISELKHPFVHVMAVVAALGALSIRVLEDGLQPSAHLVRLSVYNEEIDSARRLFQEATELQDKLRAIRTFEEASSRDLHEFLRTVAKARYVL
uniref:SMODS and SLOG-associating 2TM effector domain-containing protein n=1 Tax=Candidatus Kentrum sp. FW TaxID=2126338 RepID=A0A450T3R6_9GAMM|nr:MAG: hypothetical protein BECKFW1821A_GA0114235_111127 [Candidatus Kentron sp. FW]